MRGGMMKLQQGDVILKSVDEIKGEKQPGLILASSQATGHKHAISGEAFLFQHGDTTFLDVIAPSVLTHEEHANIDVPAGKYQVLHVREMDWLTEEERQVVD
jgi:hypothetical protein